MEMNTWVFTLPPAAYEGMQNDVAYSPRFESLREVAEIPMGISHVGDYQVWLGYVEIALQVGLKTNVLALRGFPYHHWFISDVSAVEAFRKIYASVVLAAEEHGHFENLEETLGDAL